MALTAQRKQTENHRKLRGTHHRHTKSYVKTYFPYLPLLVLVIVGLAVNSLWSSRAHVLGAATNLTTRQLLQNTNTQRVRYDEPAVADNPALDNAAQIKANDMVRRNYWSHSAPDGTTPWSFIKASGYSYQAAGENLAYGFMNAQAIVTGWMNSPEHRANVLNSNYQDIGFGIATAQNFQGKGPTTVVVALYGEPISSNEATGVVLDTNSPGIASTSEAYQNVSRVQMLTGGNAPWSLAALSITTIIALLFLVFRHALAWRRMVVKSEDFVLGHKVLDIVIGAVLVAGFILTRTAGFTG